MRIKDRNHICFLLGAGVTAEQNLPNWTELVSDMNNYYNLSMTVTNSNVTECIGIIENEIINYIKEKCNISFETARRWARCQIASAVRISFKKKLASRCFTDFKQNKNLINVIVNVAFKRAKQGQRTTIITYNFDDYFEFSCKMLHPHLYRKYVSVHGFSPPRHLPTGSQDALINVYHVHGLIPIFDETYGYELTKHDKFTYIEKNWKMYDEQLKNGIIFSGNDYASLMDNKVLGWTNVIQDICYTQLPLIVVGFSMADPNFRLLLRRMKRSEENMEQIDFLLGYKSGEEERAKSEILSINYLLKSVCTDVNCDYFVYDKIPIELNNLLYKKQ